MAPKKTTSQTGYAELKLELEAVLNRLSDDELDVDEALKNYKRGLELAKQMEDYLKSAENTIKELKAEFGG